MKETVTILFIVLLLRLLSRERNNDLIKIAFVGVTYLSKLCYLKCTSLSRLIQIMIYFKSMGVSTKLVVNFNCILDK